MCLARKWYILCNKFYIKIVQIEKKKQNLFYMLSHFRSSAAL